MSSTWKPETHLPSQPSPRVSSATGPLQASWSGVSLYSWRTRGCTRGCLRARPALPTRLLQHLLVLVLAHLLAPLLDNGTQACSSVRAVFVDGERRPEWPRASYRTAGSPVGMPMN